MVLGRRFDTQATALAKQGRLAVYPSSRGQDACQVGAALALRGQDWLFPTYRDSVAILTRGVRRRGDAGPAARRLALRLRPLRAPGGAAVHPAGHEHPARGRPRARAPRLQAKDQVALVLLGDGATSEGDAHEALNFAARLESAGGVPGAEQRVRDQRAAGQADRGADAGREGDRLRHPVAAHRRERRRRCLRRRAGRRRAGRDRRRADADRGDHLPGRGAHQRRRRHPLPDRR